ncbi:DNA repair protein endonuclease SAE2/CtIP C-terminus domain containing protein [Naviculisporaceae sp. PSN 640]
MGYWDQQGRPAIMAAVEAACDAVAETLAAEMRERDRTRHAFLADEVDRLKVSAARATELEQENLALAKEVHELRKRLKQQPTFVQNESRVPEVVEATVLPGRNGMRQPLGELPVNVNTGQVQTTKTLDFAALEKAHEDLVKKFEVKRVAAKHLKDQRDAWMKYAETLEKKVAKLRERAVTHDKPEIPAATVSRADPDDEYATVHEPSVLSSFISNPEQESRPGLYPEVLDELRDSRRAASTPATLLPDENHPSEQGIDVPRLPEGETWSGNEPDETDELPALPRQSDEENMALVKPEPSSDLPVVVSERALRKRKSSDNGSRMPPARRFKAEHNDSSDPVITRELARFSPHSSIDLDADQGAIMTPRKLRNLGIETPTNNTLAERRRQPLQELQTLVSTADYTPPETVNKPNEPVNVLSGHGNRGPRSDDDLDLASAVAALAEDSPLEVSPKSSKAGKLQSLLNQRPPGNNNNTAPLRTPSSRGTHYLPTPITGAQKGTPEDFTRTPSGPNFSRRPDSTSEARPPRHRPLRERPMSELHLEDFKINPKANNGQKHAYNEVVRNKAERAELEGCSDPNCCGRAFTAMAVSELSSGGSDILKKRENIKLLEEYLGDEAWRLGSMSMDEKKDLWLEAKKQDLAKKYGKHRHRFGRPPSPPGYWNPDFPSTQEVEARRRQGQEMERKMVEERWREATRGGGRWLFRDE